MKLGSLFDGSGGFPLAGSLCGIKPVWAAEVEPYPIAVTRSRFPNMRHLGDISKVNGAEIEPVDIITFGSPCQDLSVAGKRAGLKHEANGDEETTRSGLFMEAVRIIKEMRAATDGKYPRFALWENVPGAFSSNKGEDFRIVCEELVKIVEPSAVMPGVPEKGWAYADSYGGDGWSLAYRVFDAQYWGVPQRRRRIHLVVDFGGLCAQAILFEREGLRGYFAEGGAPWQGIAGDAQDRTGADDREGEGFDGYNGDLTGEVSSTLGVNCGMSTGRNGVIQRGRQLDAVIRDTLILDDQGGQQINVRTDGKSPTLRAEMHGNIPAVMEIVPYGISSYASNSMKSANPHSGIYEAQTSRTIDLNGGNPACHQGGIVVVASSPVYCLQGNGIDRADTAGCNGKGVKEDVCYTLNTIDRPAVAYLASGKETVGTLMANAGTKLWLGNQEAFSGDYHIIEKREIQYIVRRLTPTECARLQGFPDTWGHITPKEDFTDEEYQFWCDVYLTKALIDGTVVRNEDGELYFKSRMKPYKHKTKEQMLTWYNKLHTDSAEYKMWGNGIALPTALYVMQGIVEAMDREEDDSWLM